MSIGECVICQLRGCDVVQHLSQLSAMPFALVCSEDLSQRCESPLQCRCALSLAPQRRTAKQSGLRHLLARLIQRTEGAVGGGYRAPGSVVEARLLIQGLWDESDVLVRLCSAPVGPADGDERSDRATAESVSIHLGSQT